MAGRKMTPKGSFTVGGGPPITHLPPAMKAMFQPGPPLPAIERSKKRKLQGYTALSAWTHLFETEAPPERVLMETPRDRKQDRRLAKEAVHRAHIAEALRRWDPLKPDPEIAHLITKEPYKTLFIGRLSYKTTENQLRKEFEKYGPIVSLRLVVDKAEGVPKSKGYAFIEFERETDMREAYKRSDGHRIDGRRIIVDVERGRTVRKWKPRRLGGGLGGRSIGKRASSQPRKEAEARPLSTAPPRSAYEPPRQPYRAPPTDHYRPRDRDQRPRDRSRDDPRDLDHRGRSHRDRDRSRRDRSRSRDRSRDRRRY